MLTRLAAGDVSLTAVRRLVPVLTPENVEPLLAAARHKSKSEVEQLVAGVRARPDVAAVVRKLPTPPQSLPASAPPLLVETVTDPTPRGAASTVSSPVTPVTPLMAPLAPTASAPALSRPAVVAPLSPDRYKVQFTASHDTSDKLQRAQGSAVPRDSGR